MDITSTGGTVSTSNGTSVTIPAGALSVSTPITVGTESNAVSVPGAALVGTVYRFGPEGTQFAKPVTVTLAFDPTKVLSGNTSANIVIVTAPVGSSTFTALATTIVDSTHVSAETTHFSDFVAAVPDGTADFGTPTLDMTAPTVDLAAHNPDLAVNDDMANACMFSYSSSLCTLTGCVAGQQPVGYSLNCAQTQCQCYRTNGGSSYVAKPAPYTNTTECPGQAVMEMMWTSECSFP
jgi:hypothetical protein